LYLRELENIAIPAIVHTVPKTSNFFSEPHPNRSGSSESFGTVKIAVTVRIRYMIARSQKLALQLNSFVATPENTLPKTNPSGFPALKHAKA